MTEHQIQQAILLAVGGREDVRLWRANTGAARALDGRLVRFGVRGQADLSGILAGGRRLEVEVKTLRGQQTEAQRNFGVMIERFGGLYLVARSVEEALAQILHA